MDENKNNKAKILIIVITAVILSAAAAAMGVLTMTGFFDKTDQTDSDKPEGVVGIIRDGWDPGIEVSDNDSSEQKKGTQIPGYSDVEMKEGDTTLNLSVGNPKENHVGLIATLKLEDGTVLFTSGLMKPGQGIDELPLSQTLEKGVYDAMVFYQCVSLNDANTRLNAAESRFKIIVK